MSKSYVFPEGYLADNPIDKSLVCPISGELMQDPVTTVDGNTYERSSIEEWFSNGHSTDPVTNQTLRDKKLIPNNAIKSIVSEKYGQFLVLDSTMEVEEVSSSLTVLRKEGSNEYKIVVGSETKGKLQGKNIVFVLDESGSMRGYAGKDNNYSRLDAVTHTMNTIIALLGKEDNIAIISFSTRPKCILEWTKMSECGKTKARNEIHQMSPNGGTAMHLAIEMAYKKVTDLDSNACVSIILLSDGVPEDERLATYIAVNQKFPGIEDRVTLHTCGFANEIKTSLMCDIAAMTNGTFNYIPDMSMVGTVIIHFVANIKFTLVEKVVAELADGNHVVLGDFLKGVPKHFLFESPVVRMYSRGQEIAFNQGTTTDAPPPIPYDFHQTLTKFKSLSPWAVEAELLKLYDSVNPLWTVFRDDIASMDPNKGQIEKAFKSYNTWGCHYIHALISAYRHQRKINFKDASLDFFSSDELRAYVSKGEELFKTIPVSAAIVAQVQSRGGTATAMSSYMSQGGVCFSADTALLQEDGSLKFVKDVIKGTVLKGGFKVQCVLVFDKAPTTVTKVAKDFYLTPWHPYKQEETLTEWSFPKISRDNVRQVSEVYNLVLETGHVVYGQDGCVAVTLAHGFTTDKVVTHPFYGTDLCVKELKRLYPKEFEEGVVKPSGVLRSNRKRDGLVCGFYKD